MEIKSIPCLDILRTIPLNSIHLWLAVAILVIVSLLDPLPSIARMVIDVDMKQAKSNLSVPVNMASQEMHQNLHQIPVFYNLYLDPNADKKETRRVKALVHEQLSYLIPGIHHPVYIHSIGKPLAIPNTTLLHHHYKGDEEVTLHSLWQYCRNHTNRAVVYLHSKGSFHPSYVNDKLRMFLTRSALSRNCLDAFRNNNNNMTCNHCSSRFSPCPHPHVPGNMWMVHCSYVAQLIDPKHFRFRMAARVPRLRQFQRNIEPHVVGFGRFAAEHWIASRGATLKPCDLYKFPNNTWGYGGIPNLSHDPNSKMLPPTMFELQPAPRFQWEVYSAAYPNSRLTGLEHRWAEYRVLYNETPAMFDPANRNDSIGDIWWGWRMKAWVDLAMTDEFLAATGN